MRERKITIGAVFIVMALLLLYLFSYQVRADQMVAHYRPRGTLLREINKGDKEESGLYFKLPWPFDYVRLFDKRVRVLDGRVAQTQLSDERHVIISTYAGWRINEPDVFMKSFEGDVDEVEKQLRNIIYTETLKVIGKRTFGELVNTNPQAIKLHEIETQVRNDVKATIETRHYGIVLVALGISRIAVPLDTTKAVFDRMIKEREAVATKLRAEGEKERTKIVAAAKGEASKIVADAHAEAKMIRAEGEAKEALAYRTFNQAPDLAIFLRKLESLRTIANQTDFSILLDTGTDPFTLLAGPEQTRKALKGAVDILERTEPASREGQ